MREITFKAEDDEEHLVFAEVYAPNVPDADGEWMDADDIKHAAYGFMKSMKLDKVDLFHTNVLSKGARVVESFIARKEDTLFTPGSWVVGIHVPDDEDWAKIKKKEINGLSMEAYVKKQVVEVEMELPATLTGKTMKDETSHEHDFYATYDESGKFVGGRTSVAIDGHFHVIKRGTLTETAAGHAHRFAHLEGITFTEVE